jgi:hypothetical protein
MSLRDCAKGRLGTVLVAAGAVLASLAPAAAASDLIATQTSQEGLMVNAKGVAKVAYKQKGKQKCVLYKGALNAGKFSRDGVPNAVGFKYDRSCGWKSKWINHKEIKKFKNACQPYSGPALPYVVASCSMADGSHWVIQKWARTTPNYGGDPTSYTKETRLSHFSGEPAQLNIIPNWSWSGRFFHIATTFTYQGKPWYAVNFKENGYVLDGIGRNVTIDSYNSDMGAGWRRVNAVLTHRPAGQLCFGFSPKELPSGGRSGSGYSSENRYRLAVPGPGVSPDIETEFTGLRLEDYSKDGDDQVDALISGLIGGFTGPHNCKTIN